MDFVECSDFYFIFCFPKILTGNRLFQLKLHKCPCGVSFRVCNSAFSFCIKSMKSIITVTLQSPNSKISLKHDQADTDNVN